MRQLRVKKSYLWEITLAVTDEEAGLAAAAVADDDNLLGIGGAVGHCGRGRFSARGGGAAHHCAHCPIACSRASCVSSVGSRRPPLHASIILFREDVVVVIVRTAILMRGHVRGLGRR